MQSVWELLNERDLVDSERKAEHERLRVTKIMVQLEDGLKRAEAEYIMMLQHRHIIMCARRLGEIDREIAEITAKMEQSANRQEGVADED